MGLASLRRWENLVGTKVPCCLGNSSSVGKAQSLEWSWKDHKALPRGELVHAYVRTGDVTQERAPMEPAKECWTRMEVDDGQRDEQVECEDQPEELRRVLEAHQPTELERQKHSQTNHACCVRTLMRGVCV